MLSLMRTVLWVLEMLCWGLKGGLGVSVFCCCVGCLFGPWGLLGVVGFWVSHGGFVILWLVSMLLCSGGVEVGLMVCGLAWCVALGWFEPALLSVRLLPSLYYGVGGICWWCLYMGWALLWSRWDCESGPLGSDIGSGIILKVTLVSTFIVVGSHPLLGVKVGKVELVLGEGLVEVVSGGSRSFIFPGVGSLRCFWGAHKGASGFWFFGGLFWFVGFGYFYWALLSLGVGSS